MPRYTIRNPTIYETPNIRRPVSSYRIPQNDGKYTFRIFFQGTVCRKYVYIYLHGTVRLWWVTPHGYFPCAPVYAEHSGFLTRLTPIIHKSYLRSHPRLISTHLTHISPAPSHVNTPHGGPREEPALPKILQAIQHRREAHGWVKTINIYEVP